MVILKVSRKGAKEQSRKVFLGSFAPWRLCVKKKLAFR
jgi:hypothetical protein